MNVLWGILHAIIVVIFTVLGAFFHLLMAAPGLIPVLLLALAIVSYRHTAGGPGMRRNRVKALRWRIRLHLRPNEAFASMTELAMHWGRLAAVRDGGRARPGLNWWMRLIGDPSGHAAFLGRAQFRRKCWALLEEMQIFIAPPRTGKSWYLIRRLLKHPGPALVTTTRDDLWRHTIAVRGRFGQPIYVFNPMSVGKAGSNFNWDPLEGCDDPQIALQRAEDMILWTEQGSDLHTWQRLAMVALASMLYAAALQPDPAKRTMSTVYGWLGRYDQILAKQVLATAGTTSGTVFRSAYEQIDKPGKTADSIRTIMSESLSWAANPVVAAATMPGGSSFDLIDFLTRDGTVYMIAPGGDESAMAPLFRAFCCHVQRQAGLWGSRLPAGRLLRPLWFALDELTQVCPVPVARWLADSAGKGMLFTVVIHGLGYLTERYGPNTAQAIWDTTAVKIIGAGVQDDATLKRVSDLIGPIPVTVGEHTHEDAAMPVAALRMLPRWRALILRGNRPPVVVKLTWHGWLWTALRTRARRDTPAAWTARPPGPPADGDTGPLDLGDLDTELAGLADGTAPPPEWKEEL